MDKIYTAIFGQQTTIQMILGRFPMQADVMLSASVSDSQELFDAVKQSQPHVILLEAIPDCFQIIDLVDRILRKDSATKCIILAHRLDMLHVRQAVSAGAMGYLLMPDITDLITSVRLVNSGKFACSPEIVRQLVSSA